MLRMFAKKTPLGLSTPFMKERYFVGYSIGCHFGNKNDKEILFKSQALCLIYNLMVVILI